LELQRKDLELKDCVSFLLTVVCEDYSVLLVKMGRRVFYYELMAVVVQNEKELMKAKNLNKDLCNCKLLLEQRWQQPELGPLLDPNILERSLLKDDDILL
jgi:hypothetical protein